jgi:hypothetical protein
LVASKRNDYRRTKSIAPVLKISFPENFSNNFKGNEIKLV